MGATKLVEQTHLSPHICYEVTPVSEDSCQGQDTAEQTVHEKSLLFIQPNITNHNFALSGFTILRPSIQNVPMALESLGFLPKIVFSG